MVASIDGVVGQGKSFVVSYYYIFLGGSGRDDGTDSPSVIGTVILHDKLRAWTEECENSHYHQGR